LTTGSQTARTRVLLAEDHPGIRANLCAVLEREADFQLASVVTSGDEALLAARTLEVDVLLLDQNMPGLLGSQVAELLYAEGDRRGVVLLSAEQDIDALRLPPTVVRRLAKDERLGELLVALREAAGFRSNWRGGSRTRYLADDTAEP
jgi:two-component system response regulator AlgR